MNDRVQAYMDVDYGADMDRKSISGMLFMLTGVPISWQVKNQSTVTTSTVDSEYRSLAEAMKEAIWLGYLFKDLGFPHLTPRTINCDNQGAIKLANNPTHHARTKHLDIQLHFVKDHIENGTMTLQYCPTEDMIPNIMTKALTRDRHARLMKLMGLELNETTTPSPIEDISELGSQGKARMAMTSGSVELMDY